MHPNDARLVIPQRSIRLALCAALVLFILPYSRAQVNTDSLFRIWKDSARPDTVRLTALNKYISARFLNTDPDSTLHLSTVLYDTALKMGVKKQVASAINLQGRGYVGRNELPKAVEHFRAAFEMYDTIGDQNGAAIALNNLALTESNLGDATHAIEHMTRSLKLSEELKDSSMVARTLGNIGVIYAGQEDTANAMDYYQRRLAIAEALGQRDILAEVLMNIGHIQSEGERYQDALANYERSIAISREIGYPRNEVLCLFSLSHLRFHQGDLTGALAYDLAALELAHEIGDRSAETEAYTAVASDYHAMGNLEQALIYGRRAMIQAREGWNAYNVRDAALTLYEIEKARGRVDEALTMYELYITMRDSIVNDENKQSLMGQKFQYEYEGKEALIKAEQEKKDALAAEELLRRNLQRNAFIGGSVLAMLLAGSLFLLYRNSRRNGRALADKNRMILHAQAKLVENERALEASQVRTRIARDVHDQLGSDLTKLTLLSSEAKAMATEHPAELPAIAHDLERIASEANRSLGDIVWAIDPHHDSLAGLTERVRAHCERMLKWSKVEHTIDCFHHGADRTLDPATKRDIYLMLREALNNAIKYAKAGHINVVFHTSGSEVHFAVMDDGVGMDIEGKSSGHGLANMHQRAERSAGQLIVESTPHRGTRITFTAMLPVPEHV